MAPKTLDFYFDYLSPYAYFAWPRITELCDRRRLTLCPRPVVFGKLLDHWGQRGPAEIPPKRAWLYRYCFRYASRQGLAFEPPARHPFNPLPALRLSLSEVCGERQRQTIDAIFAAGWGAGADLGDPNALMQALDKAGLPGRDWLERTTTVEVKDALKRQTRQAVERGVFGVPTMIVDDQLFWGNDQFEHLASYLDGDDPVDENRLQRVLARQRGIDRKAVR